MRKSKYDIVYDKSVQSWDEALPLGNGKLGCLIYGNGGPLKLGIDRVDLWDLRVNPTTQEAGFSYQNLVKLVKSGDEKDWGEYRRLFERIFLGTPYPTKLTAGRVELDFGKKTENVKSRVSLKTAIANVEVDNGETGKIEAFMSATRFVGVARAYGQFNLDLHIPCYISGDENGEWHNGSGIGKKEADGCLRYPKAEIVKDGEYTYYKQNTKTDFSYGIVVLQKQFNEYSELYFTIATSNDRDNFIENAKLELEKISQIGYEQLKQEHIAWWKKYWAKSEICIPDELLEKTYYRSYYLFASCSRKGFYPMPLQGVWTADNDSLPPWKGDYHHDTNTELSYQSYLKANRLEEGEVFVDYLWSLKSTFERFAKDFFGVNGLLIPSCSTLNGKAMGGWAHYSLSPTMTIWAAQSFDEYYLYTDDEEFLRTRAYPFMNEVGAAIYGLLEEKDGKLYLPLSSSPEIFDNTRKAYLQPNSNFDLALLRYLYQTLIKYAEILGGDETEYRDILSRLDDIALDDGVILLDKTQRLEESHRHFSHLMCLYPLHLINYDTEENKKIYENALFEIERLGSGMWVGFSFAMCAQIYAMAYKGNAAYEKLYQFTNGFVADNGFHLNGDFKNYGYTTFHYRPFTLESLFGYCDALQEMLLQEHQGYLHIFPAIPDKWKEGSVSFKDLRSYGGILVSATLKEGKVKEVNLKAQKTRDICLKNPFGVGQVCVESENGQSVLSDDAGYIRFELTKGTTKLFTKDC